MWRQARHAPSKALVQVGEIGGSRRPCFVVDVGEDALREGLQAVASMFAAA